MYIELINNAEFIYLAGTNINIIIDKNNTNELNYHK